LGAEHLQKFQDCVGCSICLDHMTGDILSFPGIPRGVSIHLRGIKLNKAQYIKFVFSPIYNSMLLQFCGDYHIRHVCQNVLLKSSKLIQ